MLQRLRAVRKAKGLTLAEVAARCVPPTTAQTIGRLETGMRTTSVDWLNRIAAALDVDPSDLITLPDRPDVPVLAQLGAHGAAAPQTTLSLALPQLADGSVAMLVEVSQGDYRAGDQLVCEPLIPPGHAAAMNRDALVSLADGSFQFGRVLSTSATGLSLLPSHGGGMLSLERIRSAAPVKLLVRRVV
jgi:transcriptional regulator with XRE-family HTH domain